MPTAKRTPKPRKTALTKTKPKITQDELVKRLRTSGFSAKNAARHLSTTAGVHRVLVASGYRVSVEQLEKALQQIVKETKEHDHMVVQRARARWDV